MRTTTISTTTLAPKEGISLAAWTRQIKRSELQVMLSIAARPEIISLALGLPAAELFPADEYAAAASRVLAQNKRALQYGPPHNPLKAHIVSLMAQRGVACREEEIFLTAGAQQGLNLLTHLLLDPGGQVLLEELTYTGLQQVIEPFQPKVLTVPTNSETGLDLDAVAALLAGGARPAFIYAVTEGHNPLALSLSAAKRAQLVQLSRLYQVPIIEDDPYGFLSYEHQAAPPMKALEPEHVFYVGSFSKILAPAMRVGWLVVPGSFIDKLSIIKEASDINTSTFSQHTISAYLDTGHVSAHIAKLRTEYKDRRDAMLLALQKHFPSGAKYLCPTSGVFIWVELPEVVDTEVLLRLAIEKERVAFVPGSAFAVGSKRIATNCMRLNYSNCAPATIEEAIARLARVLKDL